jgi:hypothetical protein
MLNGKTELLMDWMQAMGVQGESSECSSRLLPQVPESLNPRHHEAWLGCLAGGPLGIGSPAFRHPEA